MALNGAVHCTVAAALVAALVGCGVDVDMVMTPNPVVLGEDVTIEITGTNRTQCLAPRVRFVLFPLLNAQQKMDFDQELQQTLPFGLDEICAAAEADTPLEIDPNDLPTPAPLAALATAGGQVAVPAVGATCMAAPTPVPSGPATVFCEAAGVAPGDAATASIMLPATSVGTLFSLVVGLSNPAGICRGGADTGNACEVDDDCDLDDCADGFCVGGNDAGDGCDEDNDCDALDCLICESCSSGGICSAPQAGQACTSDDECGVDGSCLCGIALDCGEVEVITPTPTSTPTATPGVPGEACAVDSQCQSAVCADGVCCDRLCDDPLESCNLSGLEGTCAVVSAPVPAASHRSLLLALGIIAVVGVLGITRLRAAV